MITLKALPRPEKFGLCIHVVVCLSVKRLWGLRSIKIFYESNRFYFVEYGSDVIFNVFIQKLYS